MTVRSVAWLKPDPAGMEFAEATLFPDHIEAHGIAIGASPAAYRLDYGLQTAAGHVTAWLSATVRGEGWARSLRLIRAADGTWAAKRTESGEPPFDGPPTDDLDALTGARDCDLAYSPITNAMPVRRLLEPGAPEIVDITVAWVSVPDLGVVPERQRYTLVERGTDGASVRFESLDGSFRADIEVDRDGLVVDYPGIAKRVPR